jgi:hypothetical protein
MTITRLRIHCRQAFLLSAVVTSAACANSSTPNHAGQGGGGSGGSASAGSHGGTGGTGAGGTTVGTGGSTGPSNPSNTGGMTVVGGSNGSGGMTVSGGTPAAAGITSSGGTSGVGGGTATNVPWTVAPGGYVMSGPWEGYGWTNAGGTGSTISPDNFSTLTAGSPLCASGSVGPMADYSGFAQIGINLDQAQGANTPEETWTPTGAGIVINVSNPGGSALRVQLDGPNAATDANERWCTTLTVFGQPVSFPWSAFNTACWNGSGSTYNMQPLSNVVLTVPGGNVAAVSFSACIASLSLQTGGGTGGTTGGTTATGGMIASGGTTSSGGAIATGGSSATGGSTNSDPSVCKPPTTGGGIPPCGQSGTSCSPSKTYSSGTTYCSDNSTCTACTATGTACSTTNCRDCCSGVHADNSCIAGPGTPNGTNCRGTDCKDCSSGLSSQGICVQCNINSDCSCPTACINHQCVCTPRNQPCAYPNQNCQDCCSGYYSTSGTCSCVPSGTNVLNNVCMSLTSGSTCGDFTMTFKGAPGAASACCSGNASSTASCS